MPACLTLRKAITRRQHDLYFVAFDLLHVNGHDLRDMPLEDRRQILAALIPDCGRIQFSQALPANAIGHFPPRRPGWARGNGVEAACRWIA
ncbi:hypothetical protein LJR234_006763 [Mesorhizobium amorphae]|uniref:ATP-dependent DNA ligase n=1 Tax=Mesorhizobium amorphae TaxID=71433 RepID=UPI003ED164A6